MALAVDLAGVGLPTEQASRLGFSQRTTLAGVGTAQSGGAAIKATQTALTTASSQTAAVLPSTAELNQPYLVTCTTSTTGLIFPPTGGNINGGTTNASVNLAQGATRIFMRLTTTDWASWITG